MWDNINVIINKEAIFQHWKIASKRRKLWTAILNIKCDQQVLLQCSGQPCSQTAQIKSPFLFLHAQEKESFRFIRVNGVEVFLLLESIVIKKSFNLDKVHPLLLSSAAPIIYSPLIYVINLSLKQGIFPNSLKVAKVIPVFNRALAPYVTTIAPF